MENHNLPNSERLAFYQYLLSQYLHGKLPYGCMRESAIEFKESARTVSKLWKQRRESSGFISTSANVYSHRKGKYGRRGYDSLENQRKMSELYVYR